MKSRDDGRGVEAQSSGSIQGLNKAIYNVAVQRASIDVTVLVVKPNSHSVGPTGVRYKKSAFHNEIPRNKFAASYKSSRRFVKDTSVVLKMRFVNTRRKFDPLCCHKADILFLVQRDRGSSRIDGAEFNANASCTQQ